MGDLRDQLKKARLLDDKRARQLAHEERVRRKQVGREGLEREQAARQSELQERQAADREATRRAQEEQNSERQLAAEVAACQALLERDARRPRGRGQRYYFQLADGQLPYFECDEQERFQLTNGSFVVVRRGPVGSHDYGLLPSELAERVRAAMPEVVVWAPGGAR